jgi:capsular exopolysaccharide synthesis family protein
MLVRLRLGRHAEIDEHFSMNEMRSSLPARRDDGRIVASPVNAGATYSYPTEEREGGAFDKFWAALRRRFWLIAGVFLAVLAVGAGVTALQTPQYSATALLMINLNPDQVVSEKQSLSNTRNASGAVDSEIEVLKSPALAARLASELKLDRDPEWNSALGKPPNQSAAGRLSKLLQSAGDLAATAPESVPAAKPVALTAPANVVTPTSPSEPSVKLAEIPDAPPGMANPAPATPAVPDQVVDAVSQAITVHRRGLSDVIEVSVAARSPVQAAFMANSLSAIYLKSLAEDRYAVSEKANQWLKDRLVELQKEVLQKQAAVQAYRAQRNLLTAQGVSLVEQQVAQVQSALLQTRAEYAQKKSEFDQLSSTSQRGQTVSSFNNNNDAMRDLRAKEAEIGQHIAELRLRYGPAYPALQQATDEKAALDKRIAEEMKRTAAKSKVEADALAARLSTQESELSNLRKELVSGNFDQVRLDGLKTDAESAQSVYESFLQRYHEVARQGALGAGEARVLSPARAPTAPTSPHLLVNAALSVAAALALAFLAGLLAEQFRSTIESTEEVEQRVGARALVAVPELNRRALQHLPKGNRDPTGYLLAKRLSPFAEAFRVLQASIFLSMQTSNKIIAITSAMPGEGKTTLSLGLARVAAMGGQKVIIVDCDVRMRALNRLLGINPQEGLQQVLSGECKWVDVVGRDDASGAHVLPAAGLTPKDIFGSGAMDQLITELAGEYDLIVLDCPPVFAVADARLIASLADAVVVAARARKTPSRALAAAISQLEVSGARVLGVALNCVDVRKGRRSFYDGLYYSKSFSGYYAREA